MRGLLTSLLVLVVGCVSDAPFVPMDGASDQSSPTDGSGGSEESPDAMGDGGPGDPTWTLPLDMKAAFNAMAVDAMGDIYIVGSVSAALTLDGQTIASTQGDDVLVLKLDGKTRKAIWAKNYGGPGSDVAYGLALDSGSIFLVGVTDGATITFGSDTAPIPASSNGTANHSFFARIDPVNGASVWMRTLDGQRSPNQVHSSFCNSIAARNNKITLGCTYVGGSFGFGTVAYSAPTQSAAILRFMNSGSSPQSLWTKSLTASSGILIGAVVAIDGNDDTWVHSMFSGTNASLTDQEKVNTVFTGAVGPNNPFVLRIADVMQVIGPKRNWSSSNTNQLGTIPTRMLVGPMGVAVAGGFGSPNNFPNGALPTGGAHDAYFVQLKSDLMPGWQTSLGGSLTEVGWALAPDGMGNLFGAFTYGSANVMLLNTTLPAPANGYTNAAMVKLDAMGKPLAVKTITSSTGGVRVADLKVDANGVLYGVGTYAGATTFDDGTMKTGPVAGSAFFLRRKPF